VTPVADVLLIEDDPRVRQAVVRALSDLGHSLRVVERGMEGLQQAVSQPPDVIVLDLGLPVVDGTTLLQMVRSVSDVPVIVATARDADEDVVKGLDLGADDYLIKPFSAAQLDARIRALLRRVGAGGAPEVLHVGDLEIDVRGRRATLDGEELELSRKEFDLLAYLAARPGEVVTRRELLADLWQQPWGVGDKTVDVHLSWLRRKLGETAAEPRYLRTVRGVGVKLVAPET